MEGGGIEIACTNYIRAPKLHGRFCGLLHYGLEEVVFVAGAGFLEGEREVGEDY